MTRYSIQTMDAVAATRALCAAGMPGFAARDLGNQRPVLGKFEGEWLLARRLELPVG